MELVEKSGESKCEEIFKLIEGKTPFASDEMNSKLFHRIIAQIQDSSTNAIIQLPSILLVPSLIKSFQQHSTVIAFSTVFVDALVTPMKVCKVSRFYFTSLFFVCT